MSRISAGLLMYRRREGALEVFLVHPGGPFWARKDAGAWSIPKGEIDATEEPLAAARREFTEETGFPAEGRFQPLAPITQTGGKIVQAWAVEGDVDPTALQSNTFAIEWPPRSGRQKTFPEVDRAAWFPIGGAREKINPAQAALLDELASTTPRTAGAAEQQVSLSPGTGSRTASSVPGRRARPRRRSRAGCRGSEQ